MPHTRPRVLVVLPTSWDRRQLACCRTSWERHVEPVLGVPDDAGCVDPFDVHAYVAREAARRDLAGTFSSSDYPGAAFAAAIDAGAARGGSGPRAILRASHKLVMREILARAGVAGQPWFAALDTRARAPSVPSFPCFVKPVKGAYSVFARRVESATDLAAFLAHPDVAGYCDEYLAMFNRLWRHYVPDDAARDGRLFIAEELLHGHQVTVEGFVESGRTHVIGVVDSEFYPGTRSFARFVLPSALPTDVQRRMESIATHAVAALGLDRTFWNVELVWDEATDRVALIEVNPRICGQFGDLYEKVCGRNSYAAALDLAAGRPVSWTRSAGRYAVAASVPLRRFAACVCTHAPDERTLHAVEASHAGTLVWSEVQAGQRLRDFAYEDGASVRYAVINLGAESREALTARARAIEDALEYRFSPIEGES